MRLNFSKLQACRPIEGEPAVSRHYSTLGHNSGGYDDAVERVGMDVAFLAEEWKVFHLLEHVGLHKKDAYGPALQLYDDSGYGFAELDFTQSLQLCYLDQTDAANHEVAFAERDGFPDPFVEPVVVCQKPHQGVGVKDIPGHRFNPNGSWTNSMHLIKALLFRGLALFSDAFLTVLFFVFASMVYVVFRLQKYKISLTLNYFG